MIIFFTVDLMVIVFMLFGAVGLAYEIMSVLSAIWWAIGIFAIPIGVIVICIKKLKIALGYSDEQGERANCIYIPIYLVAGVTSVLFFQSSIAIMSEEYVDKSFWWGPICALIFIQLLVGIEKWFTYIKKEKLGAVVDVVVMALIMGVVMCGAYNSFKQDIKKNVTEDAEVFIVNYDCNPAIEVNRKYRSDAGSESISFPFGIDGIFETKYPLARFKQGATVVGIDGTFYNRTIGGVNCILVYDLKNDVAGYIPEEAVSIIKKRMYIVNEITEIYAIGRGERVVVGLGGQRGTIECDVVSNAIIGKLSTNIPVEVLGSIGNTGETNSEFKFARVKLNGGKEGCILKDKLHPILVSIDLE